MEELGKIEVEIKDILGVAKPFPQGGVWRLTIPKRAVKEHDLEEKRKMEKYFSYIFLSTDKGMLLLPFEEVVRPDNIRNALKFFDTIGLSDEDLTILFEE